MGYPKNSPSRSQGNANAQNERTARLIAERGKGGTSGNEGRAVTEEDVGALGHIKVQSVYVTAAPTAAQHNALIDDMKAIATVLNRMGAKFTGL